MPEPDPPDDLIASLERPPGAASLDSVGALLARAVAAPPRAVPLVEGDAVGRYRLVRRLGAGAMGVVWAAHDPQLDRAVALKVLREDADRAPDGERAAREARALARLVHRNVVAVFDAGVDRGRVYVVMELIDGITLRAWLAERARPRDAILDVFVQAGEGLAAAHEARLIHRDFKPDNVLIDRGGRVCVADFGLARLAGAANDATDDGALAQGTPAPGTQLTVGVAGTPAFMAPEQMARDAPVDHRADQFAFAVSLWTALTGAPPFGGDDLDARRAAIARGPAVAPGAPRLPPWLVAALRRALAASVDARFPTMRALLDAIARGRGRRRRVLVAGAVTAALAAIPAVWLARGADAPAPCTGGGAEIGRVWTSARAAAVEGAFGDAGEARAAGAALRARLDDYARGWALAHNGACRAAHVDRAQSVELLDRQMACLDRARARLDGVVAWLPSAGVARVEAASRAVDELPPLAHCTDRAAQAALTPRPTDPAARAEIDALHARLDGFVVEQYAAPIDLDALRAVVDAAATVGWAPLRAEATGLYGDALWYADRLADADLAYRDASRLALEAGDDAAAVKALTSLAWTQASLDRVGDASATLALADGLIQKLGSPPALVELSLEAAAHGAIAAGDDARAVELYEREAAAAPSACVRVRALSNLAHPLHRLGRHRDAIARLDEAIALAPTAQCGAAPAHAARQRLRATMLFDAGEIDAALDASARAVALDEAWFGAGSAELADSLHMAAAIAQRVGRLDEARAGFERAGAILDALPDADPQLRLAIDGNLAIVEASAGRFDAAIARGIAALRAVEQAAGPDDSSIVELRVLLGYCERHRGDAEASAVHLAAAVALAERLYGDAHPAVVNPRIELALTELARGRRAEGVALLERVIAGAEANPDVERRFAAEARLALADALWATRGARPRARALAAAARDDYAALGDAFAPQRDAAAAWLASHAR